MLMYWPCGKRKLSDGRIDPLFTYDAAINLQKAEYTIDLWKSWYGFDIIEAWIDVYENGVPVRKISVIDNAKEGD